MSGKFRRPAARPAGSHECQKWYRISIERRRTVKKTAHPPGQKIFSFLFFYFFFLFFFPEQSSGSENHDIVGVGYDATGILTLRRRDNIYNSFLDTA